MQACNRSLLFSILLQKRSPNLVGWSCANQAVKCLQKMTTVWLKKAKVLRKRTDGKIKTKAV